jgi:hypothetical protein
MPLVSIVGTALIVAFFVSGVVRPQPAEGVVERIYTLPFYSNYRISCGFGCYSGHAGVDYEFGL